jgi:hypothetical protein
MFMRAVMTVAMAVVLAGCAGGPGSVDSSVVREKIVRSGQAATLGGYRTFKRSQGCSTTDLPDIAITTPPSYGSTYVSRGTSSFSAATAGCGGRYLSRNVGYRSAPGFRGEDETAYLVTFSDGERRAVRYRLQVR